MIAALEKRYQEVQREGKILDSEISRNNPASISVSSKVSKVNLNRMQAQNKALGSIAGRGNGATRLVALGKKPSIATSIDLSSRNGGRLQTLQTPAAHLRSNIDPNHNQLEQILSKQEQSIAKSLIVENKFNSKLAPRSTRNHANYQSLNVVDRMANIIPEPTTVLQHNVLAKRSRKFSAKMSTNFGSERADSRQGGRYLGRQKRSISQMDT